MEVRESKAEKRQLQRAERLLADLTMPSRPDVLLEVMRAQSGFAPDPVVVTELILTDLALSAAVLHAANTRLAGWKRKVISIEGAVALLGFERVRTIVSEQFLSAALVARDGPLQTLRLRAVEAGRTAARLARELPGIAPNCLNGYLPAVAPDDAYAAGLLHDCGLIAMLRGFPDYAGFCREVHDRGDVDLVAAENERFGTNHCLTGYLMLQGWQLPDSLCRIVRGHHRTDDFNRPGEKVRDRQQLVLRAILHLSASVCGAESRTAWKAVEEGIAAFFGLEIDRLEQVRTGVDAG
ncbi:MAG: HDOD domain-containing protein [Magnetococcales bacterium]|nr:HDOD domain-containing protein [Magnetococcales bacterium]